VSSVGNICTILSFRRYKGWRGELWQEEKLLYFVICFFFYTADDTASSSNNAALIAGLCIGIGALIIIGVAVGVHYYREYHWRKFLHDPLPAMQTWSMGDNYPVTQQYYKTGHKNMGFASISQPYKDFDTDDDGPSSSKSSMEKIPINIPKSGFSKA